jgi:hypothetical protein
MSLPHETVLELMALADGELQGEAKARAEKLVAESEEARQVVEAMRAPDVGAWLGEALDPQLSAADGIADAVMAKLAAEPVQEGGSVVRLSDARARRASRVQVAVAAVGAALVLAAGVALYVRAGNKAADERAPVASSEVRSVDREPTPAMAPAMATATATATATAIAMTQQGARPSQGVEVDEIDSPSSDISVFEIPLGAAAAKAGGGPSSVVIMIDDEGAK